MLAPDTPQIERLLDHLLNGNPEARVLEFARRPNERGRNPLLAAVDASGSRGVHPHLRRVSVSPKWKLTMARAWSF